jgi:hypothetical protein
MIKTPIFKLKTALLGIKKAQKKQLVTRLLEQI